MLVQVQSSILISRFGMMPQAHGVALMSGMANGSKLAGKITHSSWILQLLPKNAANCGSSGHLGQGM